MIGELQQPGYLHVLINHLPIVGTVMGLAALLTGLFLRHRKALIPGLAVLFLAGTSAWPVYETGDDAYKPVRKISDDAGIDWLDEHLERANRTVWTFYAMAGLSAAAILLPLRWPRSSLPLALAAVAAAAGCTVAAGYIAQPGGLVRHIEFRPAVQPSPAPESPGHRPLERFETS